MPIKIRKTLLKEPFIFDTIGNHWEQDAITRPQGFPLYHYLQSEKGIGKLEIAGKKYILNEGEGFLIAPNIPHSYEPEGEEWLLQLIAYLEENDRAFHAFCAEHLPQFPLTRLEGTYLEWMDCTALHLSSEKLEHVLLEKAQLWLNAGTMYGSEGEGYMRWNIACPRSRMLEGLERFAEFLQK